MAASLSRPDPSSPASVAEAGFSTARRGFHQDEVRAFLTSVAAELGRLQERERQLQAELDEASAAPDPSVELDDETVAKLLGEETLRVLHTARESASEIKIRAEENAARILREANDEANRLRQDAEVEASRKRHDASSDAEAEVALAKQQGREMVNEARAYRERVLADLERRTTLARHQIEELVHGRDRLLQVFERARLVAVDVTSELQSLDGPNELVNLSPTTGPVPLMVPNARPERTPTEPDVAPPAVVVGDVVDARDPDDAVPADDVDDGTADELADDVAEVVGAAEDELIDGGTDEEPGDAVTSVQGGDANVFSLFRGRTQPVESDAADDDSDDDAVDDDGHTDDGHTDDGHTDDHTDVGGLFARLRSEVPDASPNETPEIVDADTTGTATDIADDIDDVAAVAEVTPFSRRDEALVPLIVSAARKLKRVLADEQNGVLDSLRRRDPVSGLDDVLPPIDEHLQTYVESLQEELVAAAAAGATEVGVNDTKTLRRKLPKAGALEGAHGLVRSDLIQPLRDRLERAIADGAGDNDDITKRVRAVYREWKTQHIDDQLDDVFRFAHGGGITVTAEPGTAMVWTIDPSEASCADCEDNSLAGPVAAGEAYPTGHTSAPAHPGCRCLTVPEAQ